MTPLLVNKIKNEPEYIKKFMMDLFKKNGETEVFLIQKKKNVLKELKPLTPPRQS